MKRLIVGILFGGLFAGTCLTFYFSSKSKDVVGEKYLLDKYPNGFITKTIKLGDFSVSYSTGNTESQITDDEAGCETYPTGQHIVYLQGNGFSGQSFEVNLGNWCSRNERFVVFDVDGDGSEEIVSEWLGWAGGSGGPKALIIWKLDKERGLIPHAGYPEEMSENMVSAAEFVEIKNLKSSQASSFPMASFNDFIDYRFNTSEDFRLLFGNYLWDSESDEGHFSPHIWELAVYKFENGKFVKDESWNNGEKYLTDEKIAVSDEGYMKIRELFDSI